jgi:hypothetical protein
MCQNIIFSSKNILITKEKVFARKWNIFEKTQFTQSKMLCENLLKYHFVQTCNFIMKLSNFDNFLVKVRFLVNHKIVHQNLIFSQPKTFLFDQKLFSIELKLAPNFL